MRRSGIDIYEDFHRVEVNKRSFFSARLREQTVGECQSGAKFFPRLQMQVKFIMSPGKLAWHNRKKHTLRESMSKTNLCKFLDISRAKHPVLESFSTPQGVALRERPKKLRAEN